MTPSPLAAAGLPVAPASPDTARRPWDDRHAASSAVDFTGLLEFLAGVLSPSMPAPPAPTAAGTPSPAAATVPLDRRG